MSNLTQHKATYFSNYPCLNLRKTIFEVYFLSQTNESIQIIVYNQTYIDGLVQDCSNTNALSVFNPECVFVWIMHWKSEWPQKQKTGGQKHYQPQTVLKSHGRV